MDQEVVWMVAKNAILLQAFRRKMFRIAGHDCISVAHDSSRYYMTVVRIGEAGEGSDHLIGYRNHGLWKGRPHPSDTLFPLFFG